MTSENVVFLIGFFEKSVERISWLLSTKFHKDDVKFYKK